MYEFDLTEDILEWLDYFRPKVVDWTEELIAGEWPLSIDHVDFHSSNAIAEENGNLRIIDWEEAILSCPFSIYRLSLMRDDFVEDPTNIPQTEGRLLDAQSDGRSECLRCAAGRHGKRERALMWRCVWLLIKMATKVNHLMKQWDGRMDHQLTPLVYQPCASFLAGNGWFKNTRGSGIGMNQLTLNLAKLIPYVNVQQQGKIDMIQIK
ncbi:hypothetical protein KFU94_62585 [Chloroflexi bacterium TSY]|nr:hypothetical protein [Chloroflexi bacterium TSY]